MLISTFQPKLDNLEIRITNEKTTEKVATAILSFLKKENVNFMFGMQGGYTGGIGEEINNFPELQFIHCQHEGGAAFMADGYAKTSGKFGVILGQDLARILGVHMGDKVTMVTPSANVTPAGVAPRLKRFTVVGIFYVGMYEYDSTMALIHL